MPASCPRSGGGWRDDREPERVAVGGERPGAFGYPGDDVEDDAVAVAVLTHAGRGLGHGPDQRPRQPPDAAAAVARAVFGGHLQQAIAPAVAFEQPQPGNIGTAQV